MEQFTLHELAPDELPFCVDEEKFGAVSGAELVCPGVYLLATTRGGCYAALKEDSVLSTEALVHGVEDGGVVFFAVGDKAGAFGVVQYEVKRYSVSRGRPLPDGYSLHELARFGAEDTPEYFGGLIPPSITPRGYMTRYLKLIEGVFFVETDQCEQMLVIANPIWSADLTSTVQMMGEMTDYDRKNGIDKTLGSLFFSKRLCAVPLYELLKLGSHQGLRSFITSGPALLAAIWRYCPGYAIDANIREQMGANNLTYHLLGGRDMDVPTELEKPPRDIIPLVSGVEDTEFLQLPDSWRLERAVAGRTE